MYSSLKMGAKFDSEIPINQGVQHHIPKDHCILKFKSHN
jgi:hypothetical protein